MAEDKPFDRTIEELGWRLALHVIEPVDGEHPLEALAEDLGGAPADTPAGQATRDLLLRVLRAIVAESPFNALGTLAHIISQKDEGVRELERLRGDLLAAEELLDTTTAPKPVSDPDLKGELERINASLQQILPEVTRLEAASLAMAGWLSEAQEAASRHFEERRVLEDASSHHAIEAAERAFETRLESIRVNHATIEMRLQVLARAREQLTRQRDAIRMVIEGIQGIDIPDGTLDPEQLPDLDAFLASLRESEEEDESEVSDTGNDEDATTFGPDGLHRVKGLRYTVLFTREDEHQTRALAREFMRFSGQPETDIRVALPYRGDPDIIKYYDQLVATLADGTFLLHLKRALTLLDAMRKGDQHAARISTSIGRAMTYRTVRLAKWQGEETKSVQWALMQAGMLGEIRAPLPRLLTRVSVGSRWGLGNRLEPLGVACAQVWTCDLLDNSTFSTDTLNAVWQYAQDSDAKRDAVPHPKKDAK